MKIKIKDIPPSNNSFIGRNARWEYQSAKKAWHWLVKEALCDGRCYADKDIPYQRATVSLVYYFPDRRRRDPDNYSGKLTLDALVREGMIADDSFDCIDLQIMAFVDRENPRTEIEIKNLTEEKRKIK